MHTAIGHVERSLDFDIAAGESTAVDAAVFLAAMRVLASGVVIVTTRVDERPWGLTISSCTSVTLHPPQLLVSLGAKSVSCRTILETGRFGVSILASEHKALAELGAAVDSAKFMDEYCAPDGASLLESPMISGALFHLDCRVADVFEVGDHRLIIGAVSQGLSNDEAPGSDPLLYYDRAFWALGSCLD